MTRVLLLTTLLLLWNDSRLHVAQGAEPRITTRLFFQDDETHALKWADVTAGDTLQLTNVALVDGFPKLDSERQSLVQMESAAGFLLIGVRDEDEGKFQSGWILVETGVEEEEHGDHSHWSYPQPPRVRAALLDDKQGNPAHLYCYDDIFYLANDRLNGYTRLDPRSVLAMDDAETIRRRATFIPGGGGHITLAVADKLLGFASWIDRDGPHKGRVDVTPIDVSPPKVALSLNLPTGGIHGATTHRGKVFFAPADGICWFDLSQWKLGDSQPPAIHHLSLGKVDDKPLRTGAFATFGRYVACTTGGGKHTAIGLIDASRPSLELIRIPLSLAEGNRAVGPYFVQPRKGSPLGFVFHDHPAATDAPNRLTLLELDPDGDGQWNDARMAEEFDVGKSRVEGHAGHHSLDVDADRRRAFFTNPGDGTLTVFSISDRKPITEFRVGGIPSKIVAIGGRASGH
jgi:hypothetical protein